MLAGIVNAPSRLAPTRHLRAAQERSRLVMRSMVRANMLSEGAFDTLRPARLNVGRRQNVPTGTYFADWVFGQLSDEPEGVYGERQVVTTLDGNLQRLALRAIRRAGVGRAQVALVAMRPDGRIVAMVGGRDYARSPFNRATQARRQAGSSFKLFVYLAGFREGLRPDTPITDAPLIMGDWRPENYESRYRGRITIRDAVAYSSNSAAIQVAERVGRNDVIRAARDLGITTPLRPEATLPLGTASVSLLEMTGAYAAVAAGHFPVRPYGIARENGWFTGWWQPDVLYAVPQRGTGTAARLPVATFGKTGTTQDYRDAWFFGFAQDLVVGVWVGNDDNSPMPGVSGGGIPARIWRSFMSEALGDRAQAGPVERVPLIRADRAAPADETPADTPAAPAASADPVPADTPAQPSTGEEPAPAEDDVELPVGPPPGQPSPRPEPQPETSRPTGTF
jgi:penicillin-binding protein 1A